jgi:hypothetical protein
MFVYYNARRLRKMVSIDSGVGLDEALQAISTYGACREETWPLDRKFLTTEPPPAAYEEAKKYGVMRYYWIDDAIQALALAYPVPFLTRIPGRCYAEARRTGIVPPPTEEERRMPEEKRTLHAMVLVGYDKKDKTFIARNSWGRGWGDNGHCRISFDAMEFFSPSGRSCYWVIAMPEKTQARDSYGSDHSEPLKVGGTDPGGMAASAAKMRDEIRSTLEAEIDAASRKVDGLLSKRSNVRAGRDSISKACPACSGRKVCARCRGTGRNCPQCQGTGRCPVCEGGQHDQ